MMNQKGQLLIEEKKLTATEILSNIQKELESLDIAKIEGDGLMLTKEGEDFVYMTLLAEKMVKEAKTQVQNKLLELAKEHPKLSGYSGELVKVGKPSVRKTRKVSKNASPKFFTLERKVNTKAVNEYVKLIGKLPPGIEETESAASVSLRLIKD